METLLKILATPLIPIIYAYLELGGNWFAFRMIQKGVDSWSLFGTLIFSVLYSLVSAFIAFKLKMDMGLLMVCYGFGFSIIAIFLKLDWGKLPEFSLELIKQHPLLWIVFIVAIIGFLISAYLVITTKV